MKDIDRNINSPLYNMMKISYLTDVSHEILSSFKNVFTKTVDGVNIYNTTLQPGEYYYRHILNSVESDNSFFFILICGNSAQYPIYSYYAQSPLKETISQITIPYHFYVDRPTAIRINIWNINAESSKISGSIEIYKRVK